MREIAGCADGAEAVERRTLSQYASQIRKQGLRHLRRLFAAAGEILRLLKGRNILLVLAGSLIQAVGICNIHAFSDVTEGGTLELDWSFMDGHVYQEGPAKFVFDGEWIGEE